MMRSLIKFILVGSLVGSLVGCGVNYNLRRMAYHKRMAIAKGAEFVRDTVFTDRVVITPGDSTTVFVPVTQLKDSFVTVYQDRIKISYKTIHDTLRFQVECPPDSIIVRVPVAVNTEINCPPKSPFWRNLALALLVVTALALYFRR